MKSILRWLLPVSLSSAALAADPWLVFEGGNGPGKGKNIVLISGDEEYRSEESMPMLGRLLAEKHGFRCTVLFPVDRKTGEINPEEQTNIPGLEAVDSADFLILGLRFRELPDADMKHIVDYVEAGKPLLGLRTSTHAFNYSRNKNSPYAKWSFNSTEWPGGFGKQILGETWIAHHGEHGRESTRGIPEEKNAGHPLLTGVTSVWGPSDVYTTGDLPTGSTVLLRGQVLSGMQPDSAPVEGKKNDPMMPVAWVREIPSSSGKEARKIITVTMGAATDMVQPGLRRLIVNSAYWATGQQIPAELDVEPVTPFTPSAFGFHGYRKGVKPADLAAGAASAPPAEK